MNLRVLTCLVLFPLGTAMAVAVVPPPPTDDDPRTARAGVDRGEFVPLETLLADADSHHPGRVLEVELEGDEYEIEILQADGHVVELTYDAASGRLLEVEVEDD